MNKISKTKSKTTIYLLFTTLLFLIAFILRIYPAIIRPLNADEAYTIVYLAKFTKIIDIINHDPSVPPLQYIFVKFLSNYSTNLLWLRIPSVIFSICTLIFVFVWIKEVSKKCAFISVLLLTFSNIQISYSWQVYVYSQLCFFGLLSVYFFYKLYYEKQTNLFYSLGFFVFTIASWFTHYSYFWTFSGIFILVIISILKMIQRKRINVQEKYIIFPFILIIISLGLYAPIFINNFGRALINISWMQQDINLFYIGEMLLHAVGLYDLFKIAFLNNNIIYILIVLITTYILIYQLLYKKHTNKEKGIIFFVNILFVSNIIFPLFSSFIFKQNLLAERGLILASVLFSIQIAFLLKKLTLNITGLYFSIFYIFFYIIYSIFINRTNVQILVNQEISKYYVEWIRDNLLNSKRELNIVLFASEANPFINARPNKYVIDYYWYGYDGNTPMRDYKYIDQDNINNYKDKLFFLLVVENSKKINILEQNTICKHFNKLYEFYEYEEYYGFGIYECNGG